MAGIIKKIIFSLIALCMAAGLFAGTLVLADYSLGFLPDRDLRAGEGPAFVSKESEVKFKKVKPPPDFKRVIYANEEIRKLHIPLTPHLYRYIFEPGVEERLEDEKLFYIDPQYGRINVPNASARHQVFRRNEMIFDVTYKLDSFGRRITPVENTENRNRFLALFGCSFVFGHGVEKDQTLAFYAGRMFSEYLPVNYGVGGTGGHYVLSQLQHRNLREEINQSNGIGIYFYMDDHLERIIGDTYWSASQPFGPYYYLDGRGEVVYGGSFEKGRPALTWLQQLLFKSNIRKKFNAKWPFSPRKDDYELICKMMEKMKAEFVRQYPEGDFYIGFLPHSERDFDRLAPCLEEKNVGVLDLRNAIKGYEGPMHLELDHHPNGRSNYLIVQGISQLLGKK